MSKIFDKQESTLVVYRDLVVRQYIDVELNESSLIHSIGIIKTTPTEEFYIPSWMDGKLKGSSVYLSSYSLKNDIELGNGYCIRSISEKRDLDSKLKWYKILEINLTDKDGVLIHISKRMRPTDGLFRYYYFQKILQNIDQYIK